MKANDLKILVKEKYGEIARDNNANTQSACCGDTGCGCDTEYSVFSMKYDTLEGYLPDADLKLGCGIPTEFAGIRKGDHVLDLGSGAGNDCFVARALVGKTGHVTGLDFTDDMLEKARNNVKKLGYTNVEFVKGDIEKIPLKENTYDVVISNCVLNLVPDKEKAFKEIFRVLKPGGHFCISDVILKGELPKELQEAAEMYVGCVSGAIQKSVYLDIIEKAGFSGIEIKREDRGGIPDDVLSDYLSEEEKIRFKNSGTGIFSITLVGHKS